MTRSQPFPTHSRRGWEHLSRPIPRPLPPTGEGNGSTVPTAPQEHLTHSQPKRERVR